MTTENAAAESADATLGTGIPSHTGAGLTRAQWRRLAAEAELAARVAEAPLVSDIEIAGPTPDAAAPTSEEPQVSGDVAAPAVAEELVLTVVDSDAQVVTPPSAPAATPSAAQTRRRRRPATGESFGAAASEQRHPVSAIPAPHSADSLVDDFEFSARLFSFTAQTPVQIAADAVAAGEGSASAPAGSATRPTAVVRRGRVRRAARRMAAASVSLSAMAAVGLLAVGVTGPAVATFAGSDTRADISVRSAEAQRSEQPEGIQAYVSSSQPDVTLDRSENFDVASMADIAAGSGVTNFAGTWVNDPTAAVQWPFPVGVPISAQFGSVSYLSQFSRPHRGVDLTPGAGAEIHAVAAGTVRIATEAGGDYGVTVVIDHVVDGEIVSTRYGHMQYGSLEVDPGDEVVAGQVIGKVGSTGRSTGAHLHLEVLLGGTTQTDPMVWLREHTGG